MTVRKINNNSGHRFHSISPQISPVTLLTDCGLSYFVLRCSLFFLFPLICVFLYFSCFILVLLLFFLPWSFSVILQVFYKCVGVSGCPFVFQTEWGMRNAKWELMGAQLMQAGLAGWLVSFSVMWLGREQPWCSRKAPWCQNRRM